MQPSLDHWKKQAESLRKAWVAGRREALARIRGAHPRYATATDAELRATRPRLADCQFVVARESGYRGWRQLRVGLEAARRKLAAEFLDLACLCYDDPHYDHRSFHARAHAMLREHPELASANVWTAAAAGDAAAVAAFLETDASLANAPGGPYGWAPLLCACYSRVAPVDAEHSTYAAARVLLEHGADPNVFTWKYNDPPGSQRARRFTALTGVFGGGSTGLANQPPHPRWRELAELLLERGADPADEQALANHPGASLEILLRHGMSGEAKPGFRKLMGRELAKAARGGHADRVELLLGYGIPLEEPVEGKTAWRHAVERGHLEIARLLEQAGASVVELDDVERFVSLCLAGDAQGARAMAARDPGILERAPKGLVFEAAANARRLEAVALALDLGFDPNWMEDCAALHSAAGAGNLEMVRLLVDRGASVRLRDPWYDSTAAGWAEFFDQREARDLLLNERDICLFDALAFDRLDRVADVAARDPESLERPFALCLSREPAKEDWETPLERMMRQGKTDAVQALRAAGARR
jgi:ankyrin repeat protein